MTGLEGHLGIGRGKSLLRDFKITFLGLNINNDLVGCREVVGSEGEDGYFGGFGGDKHLIMRHAQALDEG